MAQEDDGIDDLQSQLWTASCQIRALGEVLLHQENRQAALDEADVWYGYGTILREIGERMEKWSKQLDDQEVQKAKGRTR